MFPSNWSSEIVAYWLAGLVVVIFLSLCLVVREIRSITVEPSPVVGGTTGEIFKIRPTLKPPL